MYGWNATFASPVQLDADTPYYLSIYGDSQFVWARSIAKAASPGVFSGGEMSVGKNIGTGALGLGAYNMAFELVDTPAVAAVPETAGWAMMIVGFGLCGTALRRRGLGRPSMA